MWGRGKHWTVNQSIIRPHMETTNHFHIYTYGQSSESEQLAHFCRFVCTVTIELVEPRVHQWPYRNIIGLNNPKIIPNLPHKIFLKTQKKNPYKYFLFFPKATLIYYVPLNVFLLFSLRISGQINQIYFHTSGCNDSRLWPLIGSCAEWVRLIFMSRQLVTKLSLSRHNPWLGVCIVSVSLGIMLLLIQ